MKKSSKTIDYVPRMFDKYKAEPNLDRWCYEFPEVMWALGYEMDCCHSFEAYADDCKLKLKTPKNDRETKRNILYMLEHADRQIVGNYLFSYWRYLTHWTLYGCNEYEVDFVMRIIKILEDKYACEADLKDISENVDSINKVVVESVVPLFKVSSANQCKQRLTLNSNGRVTLTRYYKGEGSEESFGKSIVKHYKKDCAERMVRYVSALFGNHENMPIGYDYSGSWWVELLGDDDKKWRFIGGFSDLYSLDDRLISPLMRYSLDLPELWVFDGRSGDDDFIVGQENDTIQRYINRMHLPKMKLLGEDLCYRYYIEADFSDMATGLPFAIMEYKRTGKFAICNSDETFKAMDDFG